MAWDFADETVRVLTEGLPTPPAEPIPGHTFPAALHRGKRYGAVLFLRLWRNGQWDSDTAITQRDAEGWVEPSGCGGGGWIDPYERPHGGWDDDLVVVLGHSVESTEEEDGSWSEVVAVEGMVAPGVAQLDCIGEATRLTYGVESPLGAFVIVVEGRQVPRLVPFDQDGRRL